MAGGGVPLATSWVLRGNGMLPASEFMTVYGSVSQPSLRSWGRAAGLSPRLWTVALAVTRGSPRVAGCLAMTCDLGPRADTHLQDGKPKGSNLTGLLTGVPRKGAEGTCRHQAPGQPQ